MLNNTSQTGFVALMSVIVLALALLVGVIALGGRSIMGRFALLDLENKSKSESYAEACVAVARVSIASDPLYTASDIPPNSVGTGECFIHSVTPSTPSAGKSTIEAYAQVKGATTNLRIVINVATDEVNSWEEVPNF